MNLTIPAAVSLAEAAMAAARKAPSVEVVVFPSFVALRPVFDAIHGGPLGLGAQDVFWKESGAYTGEVSPSMLSDAGCSYCIVGHSERRGRFGVADDSPAGFFSDTDETVSRKMRALAYVGIVPVLCVGETAEERSGGSAARVIEDQLKAALSEFDGRFVVAYEPVWAIGTGDVCEPDEAEERCAMIREITHGQARVLYGGSVKPDNARALLSQPSIDGALVGGASLSADDFTRIVHTK